jgi:hypothetical protein
MHACRELAFLPVQRSKADSDRPIAHAGFTNSNLSTLFGLLGDAEIGPCMQRLSLLRCGPPKACADPSGAAQAAAEDAPFEQETLDALCRALGALRSLHVLALWGLAPEQQGAVAAAAGQKLRLQRTPAEEGCLRLACADECAPCPLVLSHAAMLPDWCRK